MIILALKMLIGNRASCIGVIFGIFLATLLIAQQSAIFLGLVSRSYRIVTDISAPNIWVMDPATESEDKMRTMPASYLDVVRSTPGVEWAVPLSIMSIPVVSPSGSFDMCMLYGIDDATLIGAPSQMVAGSIRDLRREGAVIVDMYSAQDTLASVGPDGKKVPLKVGEHLEINSRRAVVVGICKITRGILSTAHHVYDETQFKYFNPGMAGRIGFILAKSAPGMRVDSVCAEIDKNHGMNALSREEFKSRVVSFFLKTGILINFGLSVALGVIIGFSIAGQIFYIMTLENIMYYALIKAIGGSQKMILQMIIVQAAVVGVIGYCLGIGATALWGLAIKNTTLAFMFPWQLLLFTAGVVFLICVFTAALSIQKVFRVDPKSLMGN